MEQPIESQRARGEKAHDGAASAPAGQNEVRKRSKFRNWAFKGLVILFSLFLLAVVNVVYLMIVVSWLPNETYLAIIDDPQMSDLLMHRMHDSILPVLAWSMLIGTVVQLRRPEDRVGPLLMVLAVPIIFLVVELGTGTFTVGLNIALLALLILLALLHPRARELVRIPRLNIFMTGLSVAAAATWIPFAYRQAQLQRFAGPGDPHAAMEHWNRMAVFALLVIVWSLIGAADYRGWRLTAWVAGLSSAWYGLQSLLFPSASAASLPWAVAAIGWGIVYIFAAERRARSVAVDHGQEAVQPA